MPRISDEQARAYSEGDWPPESEAVAGTLADLVEAFAADLLDARARVAQLEAAHRAILARHDDGRCTCGGCCIARDALSGTPAPAPALVEAVKAGIEAGEQVAEARRVAQEGYAREYDEHHPQARLHESQAVLCADIRNAIRALSPEAIARRIGGQS